MLSGDFDGQLWLLFQILLTTTASELSFILMWKQFSVHLCFAMTVNKAQGQSLQSVSVNLWSSAFSHDQLYVTLSQAVDVSKVSVLLPENEDEKTENVVYSEILLTQ